MSTLDHIWPSDLSRSLWNYDALQQPRNIPFMGYTFSNDFYLALAGGALIIIMFALRRFNTHSADIGNIDVRALRELKPMDLRAGALMSQAYFRYVGVLLVIYLALTLFGSLVFQAINQLPAVAGLQVDTKNVDYESPQWPLLIGLGIAGFVPMLKPVEVIEKRLRAWAHRSAGIPIRVTQQTNRIKKALDVLTGPAPDYELAPDWLVKIAPEAEQHRAFKARAQLRHLLDWSKDQRAYWPNAKARNVLKELEAEETLSAFLTLEAFDDLLFESYDRITSEEAGVTPASDDTSDIQGQAMTSRDGRLLSYAVGTRDALLRHRRRLEREWNDLTARMETSRDELASMLAIFVEHDDRTDEIGNPELKAVVDEARNQQITEDGPTFWLFLSMIPVFVVYWVAIKNEHHSMLSNFEPTTWAITLSALVNMIKTAIQFCIPVFIVLGWRHMLRESENDWELIDISNLNRNMARQLLRACAIAAIASIILFALLALLWAAIISRNEEQFQRNFFGTNYAYLPYLTSQFFISIVTSAITLIAVDFVQVHKTRSFIPLIPFGLLNVALVLILWAVHIGAFLSFGGCVEENGTLFQWLGAIAAAEISSDCYEVYDGTDLYVYALLAFCSACFFISVGAKQTPILAKWTQLLRSLKSNVSSIFTGTKNVVIILLALATIMPSPSKAESITTDNEIVRLGFRGDVQPFSYFDETEQRYRGYLVDLCLRIFAGRTNGIDDQTNFKVVLVPIEVDTRFNAFKKDPEEPKIDILCDPVTVAFQQYSADPSNDTGRDGGVFSPIVFASGVSYLSRKPGGRDAHFILSWVEGATAAQVAHRACTSDLFKVRRDKNIKCRTELRAITSGGNAIKKCADLEITDGTEQQIDNRQYFFCTFQSHKEAIDWFCDADAKSHRAYFGDRDIIVGKLEGHKARGDCDDVTPVNETYTYEPYALVINKKRPDLIRFTQRRIYEIFSNRNEIAGIFSSNFGGRKMTPTLANLFLLNAVVFNE